MPHAIPVSAASTGPVPPPVDNLIADISWVTAAGDVAQELASVPVQQGVALYDGPPLQPGLYWAIRIRREGTPGALFRSGPLPHLPGPPSPASSGQVSFLVSPVSYTLNEPGTEGAPEIVARELRDLPAPLEFSSVQLTGDQAGNYVVTLHGYLRFGRRLGLPFLAPSFSYRRAFRLVGSEEPGRPLPPVLARPVRQPAIRNPLARLYAAVLDHLIRAAVERQLEASVGFLAAAELEIAGAGYRAQTASVSDLRLDSLTAAPTVHAVLKVAGGAITATAPP